ncbi:hypothetical protein [Rickettsia endosymbiont of Oedothorax gibbosus]|nr:hypothetical protein [Rickettsia endosymbiont of Oedothorax gibbosus]
MREQFGRLGSLWERIRSLVDLFFFESMEMLWEILAGKRDYRVPPI